MADVAIVAAGRVDASTEAEVVGVASIRVGPRGPVVAVLASVLEGCRAIVSVNPAAPHKE